MSPAMGTFTLVPRPRRAQLAIRPCQRVGRVQWTHWRGHRRRRIEYADAFVHPKRLVCPCWERRRPRDTRPVVEVEVYEVKVLLQLPEHLDNFRIIVTVHFHRDLRNCSE